MVYRRSRATIRFYLFVFMLGFLSSFFSSLIEVNVKAANDSPWLNHALKHRVEEVASGDTANNPPVSAIDGGTCQFYTFNRKSNEGSFPSHDQGCAVRTPYGVVAGKYIHEYGEKYAGQFQTNHDSYHALPNSNTLMTLNKRGFDYNLYFFRNFVDVADVGAVNDMEMTYELLWTDVLTDNDGNIINVNSSPPRSSKNGRWAVTYSPSHGSIRVEVNAENGNPLPFGSKDKPALQGISNDGRYVLAHYSSESTRIYDLDKCEQVPSRINGPVECQYREISGYIDQHFPNLDRIFRIEFLNEDHVMLDIRHWDDNGNLVLSIVQLTTEDNEFAELDGGYIAMGDSFASGEGDMDSNYYEVGTDEPENRCHLSRRSYPYLLDGSLDLGEFHSVACSGAETGHVLGNKEPQYGSLEIGKLTEWLPGFQAQINYINSLPTMITLSIGGNDIGFGPKLTECILGPGTCKYAESGVHREQVAKEIAALGQRLRHTYERIASKTHLESKIYVIGYPQIIKPDGGSCGRNVSLNKGERQFIYEATRYMNQVIEAAAKSAGVQYLNTEHVFEGRNLCSIVSDSTMAVNGLTFGDDKQAPWWAGFAVGGAAGVVATENIGIGNESYHPNQNGHQLLAAEIMGLTGGNPATFQYCEGDFAVCPDVTAEVPVPDESYWGGEVGEYISNIKLTTPVTVDEQPQYKRMVFVDDERTNRNQVRIKVEHLAPGSDVKVEVHSDPVTLGTYQVDENGILEENITIPNTVTPGFHTLRLAVTNTVGETVEYYDHIFVPGGVDDIDDNGVLDSEQACGFVEDSNEDSDGDGIDDACDGFLAVPLENSTNEEWREESRTQPIQEEGSDNPETISTDSATPRVLVAETSTHQQPVVVDEGLGSGSVEKDTSISNNRESIEPIILWTVTVAGVLGVAAVSRRYSIY